MMKISAQKAAAMEMYGWGTFEVRGRLIVFTGADGRSAIWECASKKDAEMQLRSWRRAFNPRAGAEQLLRHEADAYSAKSRTASSILATGA